ncbi:hypothetical protein [Bacillus sp. ISL-7]|uniref:hypothetical protein n=1 Tax=Bacillus sp. ISL-7 TaxID=2819136 RepID=UPI001BEB528E|nr:hypothetical protein [Bacillus sp. ISL-7]MBT2734727.1 hypothetical protein [Bacillus sp. ISL-7]
MDDELFGTVIDPKFYKWLEKSLIDSLTLHGDEQLVIEVKTVGGVEHKIANRYLKKPTRWEVSDPKEFRQPLAYLMDEIYWRTGVVITNLKDRLDVKSKKEIYQKIGDAMGYTADAIKKQISGKKTKSIKAELIVFLEQEFNVHRDQILGPIRIINYAFDNDPNLHDLYRDIDNIAAKDTYIEKDLRILLNALINRLQKYIPNQTSDENARLELDKKLSIEIAKITKCLSSNN